MWIKNCPHKFCYLFSAESISFGPAIRPLIPTILTFISGGFLESQNRPVVFINLTSLFLAAHDVLPSEESVQQRFRLSSEISRFPRRTILPGYAGRFPYSQSREHLSPTGRAKLSFRPSRRVDAGDEVLPETNDRDLSRWPALDSIPFFPI